MKRSETFIANNSPRIARDESMDNVPAISN
jgi:hypothetical protein